MHEKKWYRKVPFLGKGRKMVQIDNSKGLIHEGNDERILACMARALKGESIKVAFLGGSITQGSVASTPEKCYAYLTYEWWKEQFPKAEITYINAGIGGTTSHLGTGRVEEEVLSHKPDFVIVEFSVNDADTDPHFEETYEGLIRRILNAPFMPALLLVHNVRYDDGGNAEAIHCPVEKHYQIPGLSMKSAIYPYIADGRIARRDITPDDLHPNDAGHKLVAGVITAYLSREKEKAEAGLQDGNCFCVVKSALPAPLTQNGYENAHRYRNDELVPVICEGFVKDTSKQECIADSFRMGFSAAKINDKIVFEVEASSIAVQYRKTVRKPAPVAELILDGDTEHAFKLDANFEEDWGDCLFLETVLEHGERKNHTVEIRITEAHEDDREVFYLVSLITA